MNFNYSYRAFLITSLLFGILFTILFGINLKSDLAAEEENESVEYIEIIPEVLEELASNNTETVAVETNRAYNEAEKFIRDLESERDEAMESAEDDVDATQTELVDNGLGTSAKKVAAKKVSEEKKATKNKVTKTQTLATNSANRRTTIQYNLVDRKAMDLPNPVYTCATGGKVVITIEVDAMGRVTKTNYNKSASTTSNGCLVDSALDYARTARFNTKAGKKEQLGTITYNFPGQGY